MSQFKTPEFTLFPWQLLACAVPLMALAGAGVAHSHQKPPDEVAQIFFGVLAAGNGYLLAAAIGDFGRSMIVMPVGAAAALIGVYLFSFPAARGLYVALLGIFITKSVARGFLNDPLGVIARLGFTFFLFVILVVASVQDNSRPSPAGIFLCYPFIWSILTASMPAEDSLWGRFAAMETGLVASLYGLIFTAIGALVTGLIVTLLPLSRSGEKITVMIVAAGGLIAGNYICIKLLFTAASRVMPATDHPAAVQEEIPIDTAHATPEEPVATDKP